MKKYGSIITDSTETMFDTANHWCLKKGAVSVKSTIASECALVDIGNGLR